MAAQDSLHNINGHKMIAVASGKGGVGKTWFAITLAHAMARSGKNILLFDGDLGLANVDIQLGLMPNQDLGSVLSGKIPLKNAVMRYGDGNFDILAGRSGTGSLARIPGPRLNRLMQGLGRLSESYDAVVMDLGAGVDNTVQTLAAQAGLCLLVVTDEPTSLTDAYAFIKLSKATHPDSDIRIIVNAAESQKAGEKTYETLAKACRNFLKYDPPLMGVVRQDKRVREAIRSQIPLLTRSPASDAGDDVDTLAGKLPF